MHPLFDLLESGVELLLPDRAESGVEDREELGDECFLSRDDLLELELDNFLSNEERLEFDWEPFLSSDERRELDLLLETRILSAEDRREPVEDLLFPSDDLLDSDAFNGSDSCLISVLFSLGILTSGLKTQSE